MKPSEVPIIFIIGTLTLMVFVVFVVLIVVEYRRRQVRNIKEQLEQEHRHERELLQTKADVERQMLETEKVRLEEVVAIRTAEVVAQKEEIERHNVALQEEKKKSDDLLLNILPAEVADELKEKGRAEARFFDNVTVLFTDFVDFTTAAERMSPQELVDELDVCFKAFDRIVRKYGCEKIKTIGDAYLAVCGLPQPDAAHAEHITMCALEIVQFMAVRKLQPGNKTFDVRVGIHSGSVVAGIVGLNKFAYDIWGDTVNTAARMEQNSEPGRINISQVTYELVKDRLACSYRGELEAKHKGMMKMYFVG